LNNFNGILGKENIFQDLFNIHSLYDETKNNGIKIAVLLLLNNFKVINGFEEKIYMKEYEIY